MPDDSAATPQPDEGASPGLEVIETDSGRKPLWGIVAGIAFVALSVFAVLRVTAGDGNSSASYSSSVTTTTTVGVGAGGSRPAPRRNSTPAAIFFFALIGVMVLVAVGIYWRARLTNRAASS
ncbi:MAG: hypothetical protein ABI658_20345 [Acidimicrobiales bacterium]